MDARTSVPLLLVPTLLVACGPAPSTATDDASVPRDDAAATDRDATSGDDAGSSDGGTPIDPDHAHYVDHDVPRERQQALDDAVLAAGLPAGHPRLFGDDATWLERVRPFETLDPDCSFEGEASGWGTIKNARAMWWSRVWDGDPCDGDLPTRPEDHRVTAFYLDPSGGEGSVSVHHDRQLRAIWIIRRELACQAAGGTGCRFSSADLDRLIDGFVAYEMARLRGLARNQCGYVREWHRTSQLFMDIGSDTGFRFFSLFLDTLHDHPALSAADRGYVSDLLEAEIDSYLCSLEGPDSPSCGDTIAGTCSRGRWGDTAGLPPELEHCHWSLCGGNNWTPLIDRSALFWVIALHDESPEIEEKAGRVLRGILATSWLHRRHILDDGTYTEGSSYIDLSLGPTIEMNALLRAATGLPFHAYRWGLLDRTAGWLLENMGPDGRMADFGDAWDRSGFSTGAILDATAWRELVGLAEPGTTEIDACLARRYFQNSYYDHAFDDPWQIEPGLARDWAAIAAPCAGDPVASWSTFDDQMQAISRATVPGATALAGDGVLFHEQADDVWLTMSATPNDFPHREADWGALIWSAYGHRLLYDFGYGQIFHHDSMEYVRDGTNHLDYFALGANTMVIAEATHDSSYFGQLEGARGTLETRTIAGIEVARADGSAVHGAGTTDGMLEVVRRWMLRLDGGVHVIVDAFRASGDRALGVHEFFWTSADGTDCTERTFAVDVAAIDARTVELRPRCSELARAGSGWQPAEARGRVIAAGEGAFERGLPSWLASDARLDPFVSGNVVRLPTRTGGEVRRELFRFAPAAPEHAAVRAFLLLPGTTTGFADASIEEVACEGATCFDARVGSSTVRVTVDDADLELALEPR